MPASRSYQQRRGPRAHGAFARSLIGDDPEAEVAGRAVGRVGAARRHAVAAAVRLVAEVGAAAHRPGACPPAGRSGRAAGCAGSSRGRTSRRTTPRRCRSCCAARTRWAGRRRPAPCRRSRRPPCSCCGNVPWNTFIRCRPPGSRSSPHGNAADRAPAACGELPLGLRRQARPAPRAVGLGVVPRHVDRPGGRRGRRGRTAGPSGWRQSAPYTWRHHGALATARVSGKSSGRNPANTNDHPKRSASVTWPVASTNAAKRSLVTAWASMRNGASSTTWIGPSPSAGVRPGRRPSPCGTTRRRGRPSSAPGVAAGPAPADAGAAAAGPSPRRVAGRAARSSCSASGAVGVDRRRSASAIVGSTWISVSGLPGEEVADLAEVVGEDELLAVAVRGRRRARRACARR